LGESQGVKGIVLETGPQAAKTIRENRRTKKRRHGNLVTGKREEKENHKSAQCERGKKTQVQKISGR